MLQILFVSVSLGMALFSANASADVSRATSKLSVSECRLPEVYSFSSAQCAIRLENSGDVAIHVSDFRIPLDGSSVFPEEILVPAHSGAEVRVLVKTDSLLGKIDQVVSFSTNEVGFELRKSNLRGFTMSVLDEARPKVDFGEVDTTDPISFRKVALSSRELSDFHVLRVISAPAYLSTKIEDDHRTVKVGVKSDAPWGWLEGDIKVEINSPRQKYAVISVKANIHGDITAPGNPLWFGFRQADIAQELLVPLTSSSGRSFSLGRLTVDNSEAKAEPADCEPPSETCKAVKLSWGPGKSYGMRKMTLRVQIPSLGRELPIQLWGFLTQADGSHATSTTSEMNGDASKAEASKLGAGPSAASADEKKLHGGSEAVVQPQDPAEARFASGGSNSPGELPAAVPNDEHVQHASLPAGSGPLLKWSVTNEKALYGFQVFRADSEAGPYVLLNSPAIPVDHAQPSKLYQWRDNSAVKGKTYWYYVGVVYNDARKEKITPEMKATAK